MDELVLAAMRSDLKKQLDNLLNNTRTAAFDVSRLSMAIEDVTGRMDSDLIGVISALNEASNHINIAAHAMNKTDVER